MRALGIYMIAVFVGGALLAPLLYWLAQSFAGEFPKIANSPFHRFINRSLLSVALLGLWPLFRALGAGSLTEVGLVPRKCHWKELGVGFALGFVSLAIVAAIALAGGARVMEPIDGRLWQRLFGAALTATVVAVLEEVLFRGAIFGALRKAFHWVKALIISSMIYALVHFMQSASPGGTVHWYSGLEILPQMLRGFADFHQLFPGFLTLTVAGLLLGLAYQRTGALYFSIGLHAGWIFWLKSYGILTRAAGSGQDWFWGKGKLIDGWLALGVMVGVLVVFVRTSGKTNAETRRMQRNAEVMGKGSA